MSDIERTLLLLDQVFPGEAKFQTERFLTWQYEGSPSGVVIEQNVDDEVGRLGHYAVLPQRWGREGRVEKWALSLNTAVSERARGRGLFSQLASQTYDTAAQLGVTAIVGVANANSTPGFTGRLGFDLVGPLNAAIVPWKPSRGSRSVEWIPLEALTSDPIALTAALPAAGMGQRLWDTAELTWRLSCPTMAFTTFRSASALVVTCASKFRGVPVAIIVKVVVADDADMVELGPIAAAACRFHRAPAAVYAGFNPRVITRGLELPQRFRPSPLNLIVKSLVADEPSSRFVPVCFEFLDFDAY